MIEILDGIKSRGCLIWSEEEPLCNPHHKDATEMRIIGQVRDKGPRIGPDFGQHQGTRPAEVLFPCIEIQVMLDPRGSGQDDFKGRA